MGELLSCHQSVKREALVPSGKGSLLLIDTENVVLEDINSFFYSTCTSKKSTSNGCTKITEHQWGSDSSIRGNSDKTMQDAWTTCDLNHNMTYIVHQYMHIAT